MALTQAETDLITASTDGANKVTQLGRMSASRFDDYFGENLLDGDGNPASAGEKAAFRTKVVQRIVNYPSEDHIRAFVNLDNPWFNGTNLVLSSDNDYNAREQAAIEFFAKKLANTNTGFSVPKHPVYAIQKVTAAQADLNTLLTTNNLNNRLNFLKHVL